MTLRSGFSRWLLLAAVCYAAMVVAVVWLMFATRQSTLVNLDTPQAKGNWQAWRDDVAKQQGSDGPVARDVPKSAEPPGLVLMRDYFAVCLVAALLFMSLLYWVLVWFVSGILRSSQSVPT